ncbi:MAG TPA: acetylxylan esterase, partial [Planctomycetaceae bacterium]|nr:acetylxylan esterase [Planctomycetaceae bacterium]
MLLRTSWLAMFFVATVSAPVVGFAQPRGFNYDESKVPEYTLPAPLVCADGTRVTDAATWMKKRRPEILELFRREVYGRSPGRPESMRCVVTSVQPDALGGKAVRKEVTILFAGTPDGPFLDLLIYLPADVRRPVPLFLGLNFSGNHSIHIDPGITLSRKWMRARRGLGV